MRKCKNNKGFTLIELLATIAILAIVVSITLYVSLNAIEKSREKSYKVTINNIEKEAANYLLENSDRLFFISYGEDIDTLAGNIEYQCITVQNLIDMGYFDEDIIESKIAKDINVNTDMYVYIERDKTTKTVNKTVLASIAKDNEIPEGIVCSEAVKAKGDISFVVEPLGWSKEKKITLYYSLNNLNDVTTIGDYKYDYEYDATSENIYGNNTDTERQIKVTSNGTLDGYITLETLGDIANKKLEIDNIDNVGPVIELGEISQKYVSKTVAIPLKVSDVGSGVNYSSFDESDIEVKVGGNIISDISLSGDGKGNFNLIINNDKYSGEVAITIAKNSVYDKVVDEVKNGNNETVLKPDVKFDNTAPTKPDINNPTNENWTNSNFPLSVSTIEDGSGVDYWQYTYAENPSGNGDHNTSWVTYSNSSNNNFTTSPFSAERNQLVYIRVCDKVGNCSEVSNTYIRIDKKAPTITLGSNSDITYTKTKSVTVTIKDASSVKNSGLASGASLKYGWSISNTTEPSSYTTVNPTYTVGTTSEVTFTASGSGLTGSYYLWVKPVTLKDVAGNSNTTSVVSTGTFKFDNIAPNGSISVTSSSSVVTATLDASDAHSGLSETYGWKISSSSTCNDTVTDLSSSSQKTYQYTTSSSGTYYACVKVFDNAGNVAYISSSVVVNSVNCYYIIAGHSTNCRYIPNMSLDGDNIQRLWSGGTYFNIDGYSYGTDVNGQGNTTKWYHSRKYGCYFIETYLAKHDVDGPCADFTGDSGGCPCHGVPGSSCSSGKYTYIYDKYGNQCLDSDGDGFYETCCK